MLIVKLFTAACMAVILSAWIEASYESGNRFWVWAHGLVDLAYERWYLGMWRAMMRHMADPAYDYHGRHFGC